MAVDGAPYNKPEKDELVIKIVAVATKPADVKMQELGIIIQNFPAILACEAAGIFEEVGSGIISFKPGDCVIGQTSPIAGILADVYKYASSQKYVVLKMPLVAKIPVEVKFSETVVLPLIRKQIV